MTNDAKTQNAERAGCAEAAFIAYGKAKERVPENSIGEERLTDLLTDLRHLARREGWDFDAAERLAAEHFSCEVAEEDEDQTAAPLGDKAAIEAAAANLPDLPDPDTATPSADEPDLLRAAKCALADLEGLVEQDRAALTEDDGETDSPLGLTVKELKAAIAKAEGDGQ
jgi:hypothetical protein